MNTQKRYLQTVCYVALFFLFYLITYTGLFPLKIGNAAPAPLIPLTVCVAFFFDEWKGFIAGVITGIAMDAVASEAVCFNTFIMLIIGLACGLLVTHYLNRNVYTIGVLSITSSLIYFGARWLLQSHSSAASAANSLLFYALPSAVYSALFIIPFYFLGLLINRIGTKQ